MSTATSELASRRHRLDELTAAAWSDWSCLIRLVVSDPSALDPAAEQLRAHMRRVEAAASRFRVDSELNWANANAGRPVAVSRTFLGLLDAALGEARRSGGALDPTLGRELADLGYDRDITLVAGTEALPALRAHDAATPPAEQLDAAHGLVPAASAGRWSQVRLDRLNGLVTVPPGSALDLGASAKAQTADWAATALAERFGCDVLVELGGDVAVGGNPRPWQLHVAEHAGGPGQQVSLNAGGLTTSTTTLRRWSKRGESMHHIVDPATGRPADGRWRTATVAASSALHANTCSTTAIVLGDRALDWLAGQRVAARLVDQQGEVVTVGGWPC